VTVFRRSKSVVGLDLGHQTVKAVEISMEGPEPVITGFAHAEVPSGTDRAEAVSKVLAAGKFKSKSVVASVSGQSVVVRYITMMQMNDAELRQAIRFESDKYLPFEADEVQIDCQRLERKPHAATEGAAAAQDQMSVVIAACKKSAVEERVREITRHGLTPLAVDVDVFALANAWELCGLSEMAGDTGQRAIALVDVGASVTSINVLCGGETCFSREIGIGGQDMTQAIARRLSVENSEAEAIKRDPQGREAEISRAITPVLEDMVSELTLSLDYVENREGLRVEEILLSGGGVLAPGTVSFLEQATGRTARTWNPLEGLRVAENRVNVQEMEACAPSLAVAIGLASRVCAQ
jgi:type IV pilus assembly protein PilM